MTVCKLLGQSVPNAATLSTLYTAPACACATVDTISVCNRAAVATTFRMSVAPKGDADTVAHYLYCDHPIQPTRPSISPQLDPRRTETDEPRVYAAAATLTFNAFGTETL